MSELASGLNSLRQEWALLRTAHPNVLLVGADEAAVVRILDGLRLNCRQPVETREVGSVLSLPFPSQAGALILRDVGNLTQESQRRLMEWLDDNHDRIQVIATNGAALWPQVRDGAFTEALYYRLNMIYIDLTEGAVFSTDR